MTSFKILIRIAKLNFIKNLLHYRLSQYESDCILDFDSVHIVVLKDTPGILVFRMEKIKNKYTHYEVTIRSKGEYRNLGIFPFNTTFPNLIKKPNLKLVI